jgi:chloride channel protein, CIC family
VCEMTGGYSLVVPLMFTSVVTILLSQRWSLYEKQVLNKFHSPAHRSDTIINILATMKVRDAFRADLPIAILPEDMSFAALKRFLTKTRESFFAVVDGSYHLRGILCLADLREIMFEEAVCNLLVVGELASAPISIGLDDSLYDALVLFLQTGYGQIPIEDKESGVIGILRLEDLMESYHQQILNFKND